MCGITTQSLDIIKVCAINGEEETNNALWNILTGVKFSTAGAAVQISVLFSTSAL